LNGSRIKIKNVSVNPTRAGILDVLKKMGANIKVTNKKNGFEPTADITVAYSKTRGVTIDADQIPSVIDELPIIFVLAALSNGRTVIKGAQELRVKETDRIDSMSRNLNRMGSSFAIEGDSIIIEGVERLSGSSLESFKDHRTCMAMTIAALCAEGESVIEGTESVSKSFPDFFDAIIRLTT
jgi:3-phosphoshikimate 1-carboxyvinyltransferase